MDAEFRRLVAFLRELGTDAVPHTGGVFLAHLTAVYRDLASWGCDEDVCRAGLFHSIYGTERFQKFALPLDRRPEVQELLGKRAERLAYLNCAMVRSSFDRLVEAELPPSAWVIDDRFTGKPEPVSPDEFDDLCTVHLCDWLEQVPRCRQWDYRRSCYERLALRLGGPALEAFRRVYGR